MFTYILLGTLFFLGFLVSLLFLMVVMVDAPNLDIIECDACGGLFPREDMNGDELIRRTDEGDFCVECRS